MVQLAHGSVCVNKGKIYLEVEIWSTKIVWDFNMEDKCKLYNCCRLYE